MTEILFIMAIFLISLGTWLSPVTAIFLWSFRKNETQQNPPAKLPISLDILVPAHNEPESLPVSLQFFKNFKEQKPEFLSEVKISVALSNWSGPTALKAAEGADQILDVPEKGKWAALIKLAASSQGDWVAFVDSGTIWQGEIYSTLLTTFQNPQTMGLNPTYFENGRRSGILGKIWKLESLLKSLENQCGGPISLHGSTVLYRRSDLKEALSFLGTQDWKNDDVVIPLVLRHLFPQKIIVYSNQMQCSDQFPSSGESELGRRKRLVLGNIQWMRAFVTRLAKTDLLLFVLTLRRISRMMWAWWFILLGAGFIASLPSFTWMMAGLAVGVVLGAGLSLLPTGRRLLEAFWASLAFPIYLGTYPRQERELSWK